MRNQVNPSANNSGYVAPWMGQGFPVRQEMAAPGADDRYMPAYGHPAAAAEPWSGISQGATAPPKPKRGFSGFGFVWSSARKQREAQQASHLFNITRDNDSLRRQVDAAAAHNEQEEVEKQRPARIIAEREKWIEDLDDVIADLVRKRNKNKISIAAQKELLLATGRSGDQDDLPYQNDELVRMQVKQGGLGERIHDARLKQSHYRYEIDLTGDKEALKELNKHPGFNSDELRKVTREMEKRRAAMAALADERQQAMLARRDPNGAEERQRKANMQEVLQKLREEERIRHAALNPPAPVAAPVAPSVASHHQRAQQMTDL